MRIYVIRHGKSETNCNKQWTGWLDVHLTDKGKADAKKASELLKGISFNKIYTSDLKRAIETAETAIPNCRCVKTKLLREINVGTLSGEPSSDLSDEQKKRITEYGYIDFDGETNEQFRSRIRQMMNELETLSCETVALFSHAGWMQGMLDAVLGTYLPRKHIRCNNCSVAIFEYTNENWQLHSWINHS